MIILDTNVLSEIMKPRPADALVRWLAEYPIDQLFITAITRAEILYGLELLPVGKRRADLAAAASTILDKDFAGRILPFDADAAGACARIMAERRALGRPIEIFDAQIAAIARSLGAPVATRDWRDFEACGITVLDPWSTGGEH